MNENQLARFMKQSYELGKIYWQQADSESYKQNAKSFETQGKFEELLQDAISQLNKCDIENKIYDNAGIKLHIISAGGAGTLK